MSWMRRRLVQDLWKSMICFFRCSWKMRAEIWLCTLYYTKHVNKGSNKPSFDWYKTLFFCFHCSSWIQLEVCPHIQLFLWKWMKKQSECLFQSPWEKFEFWMFVSWLEQNFICSHNTPRDYHNDFDVADFLKSNY
jgi:hypothetical protein